MTALVRFRRHHVSAIPFLQRWRIGGYKRARHRRFQCSSRIALKSFFGKFVEIQHALNSFLIFQNASYRDQMIRVKWNYNKVVDNLADFQTVENWRHIRCATNRNSRYVCRILNVALTCRWSRNCRLESHGKRVWWCRLTHRCIAERLSLSCRRRNVGRNWHLGQWFGQIVGNQVLAGVLTTFSFFQCDGQHTVVAFNLHVEILVFGPGFEFCTSLVIPFIWPNRGNSSKFGSNGTKRLHTQLFRHHTDVFNCIGDACRVAVIDVTNTNVATENFQYNRSIPQVLEYGQTGLIFARLQQRRAFAELFLYLIHCAWQCCVGALQLNVKLVRRFGKTQNDQRRFRSKILFISTSCKHLGKFLQCWFWCRRKLCRSLYRWEDLRRFDGGIRLRIRHAIWLLADRSSFRSTGWFSRLSSNKSRKILVVDPWCRA